MPRKDCWYCYFVSRAQFRRRSTNQSINPFTLDPNQKFVWAKIADIFAKWQPLLFGLIGLTTAGLFLKRRCFYSLLWKRMYFCCGSSGWLISVGNDFHICCVAILAYRLHSAEVKWQDIIFELQHYDSSKDPHVNKETYNLNKMDMSPYNGSRSVWSHFISWNFMEKFDVHTPANPLPPISNIHWNLLEKG